jgi:transcriptional regulator with XRE-family HTH domain
LADRAGVGIMTIHQLEKDGSQPRRATLDVVRRAFELAGVEFIDENGGGPGVRLRKSGKEKLRK